MSGERREKMKQVLSNKIKRKELEIGDHIYTWRYHKTYAHHGAYLDISHFVFSWSGQILFDSSGFRAGPSSSHSSRANFCGPSSARLIVTSVRVGIYVGDGKVIHFTPGVIFSSSDHRPASHHDHSEYSRCPRCDDVGPRNNGGVESSCLECFLKGGKLYRFRYGVSKRVFYAQVRGTSTLIHSDSPEDVLHRAKTLLDNGFRNYNLFKNNCENFAIYCKTGYIGTARCGQIGSLRAAVKASIWPIVPIASITTIASAAGIAGGVVATLGGGAVVGGAMAYCVNRYVSDIGIREGMEKIPVETLVNELA